MTLIGARTELALSLAGAASTSQASFRLAASRLAEAASASQASFSLVHLSLSELVVEVDEGGVAEDAVVRRFRWRFAVGRGRGGGGAEAGGKSVPVVELSASWTGRGLSADGV